VTGDYISEVLRLRRAGRLPRSGVVRVHVLHDTGCGIFQRQHCGCRPEITFAEAHDEGHEAEDLLAKAATRS
jgi:hypothetical protein